MASASGGPQRPSMLRNIVTELLETERSYMSSLTTLWDLFVRPLESALKADRKERKGSILRLTMLGSGARKGGPASSVPSIDRASFVELFSNIWNIMDINTKLLSGLEEAMAGKGGGDPWSPAEPVDANAGAGGDHALTPEAQVCARVVDVIHTFAP